VPHRLGSIYCARMPEDKAPGFKREFEDIVKTINAELGAADGNDGNGGGDDGEELTKILLLDGARSLWNYVAPLGTVRGSGSSVPR